MLVLAINMAHLLLVRASQRDQEFAVSSDFGEHPAHLAGTTTLEAALADTPMVVAYKVHPLTYHLFQRLRTVRWVSLVNLVAEREVVPELLQDRAETPALVEALRPLLDPRDPRTVQQREGLALVRARLGDPGATDRVVALADELLTACG